MAANIVEKELGEELMLYDLDKDEIHVLNPTARLVYQSHREGRSREETERLLRERFRTSVGKDVQQEVEDCLAMLRGKGLIGA